jgi:hypothetical protein
MEYDMDKGFAEFIIDAIDCHLEAFPEWQDEADKFLDLFCVGIEIQNTLHINFERD